jgi:hypothetical protein
MLGVKFLPWILAGWLATIAGGFVYTKVETARAFKRGETAGAEAVRQEALREREAERQRHRADMEKLKRTPPDQLDAKIRELCRERGGTQCD